MQIVARSDNGRIRRNNEDAVGFDQQLALAVLADGMGGLEAGEVASRLAVDCIIETLRLTPERTELALRGAVEAANSAIVRAGERGNVVMGTTVVAWLLAGRGQCFVAHVGDSRVYRLRSGRLKRLTADHSMVQKMVDDGLLSEVEAHASPHRNVVTRALGVEQEVRVDLGSWVVAPEDLFLLCSDGLTDMVEEAEIERLLARHMAAQPLDLEGAAQALVERANDAGGEDNVTVLLVHPEPASGGTDA